MPVTANRQVVVILTEDTEYSQTFDAVTNTDSPGVISSVDLSSGANTITVPTPGTISGVTIIPPSNNTQTLTLKGVTGDTGVAIAVDSPSSIGLASSVTTFVLTAGGSISSVRLIFT